MSLITQFATRVSRSEPARLDVGMRSIALHLPSGRQGVECERRALVEGAGIDAVCAALRSLLTPGKGPAVDARLSTGWSRLQLLPWIGQLTSEERWRNYARARFEQVFGESAAEWDVHVARDLPGRDRLAVAWPVALRDALSAEKRLRSVRVGLLEHLGVLLQQEPEYTGCIAEVESGLACFLLLTGGRVRRVRSCRFDDIEGLVSAVCSEWASVIAADGSGRKQPAALALTPPVPTKDSMRALAVTALAAGLGIRRAFSLPDWT